MKVSKDSLIAPICELTSNLYRNMLGSQFLLKAVLEPMYRMGFVTKSIFF